MEASKSNSKTPLLLIHGALRSRVGLWPTALYFRARGFDARSFHYASRQGSLEQHAELVEKFIEDWFQGEKKPLLTILTHSMGALVARTYLNRPKSKAQSFKQRLVMLGPPNQGAILAERFQSWPLFHWVYGKAAQELLPSKVKVLPGLPKSAKGLVLAGGRNSERGYFSWIDGDNDGFVSVEEAKLPGAEFEFVGGSHSWLQWRRIVLDRACLFFDK